ncbi:cob(I)yrinic acid a,c-diamide adenosyltransferase [Dissulfurirhabdus thermomarina]|uniref:Cob(I)yrinic acid a,c-diamide adenosyltransferase n=1 Tax=Dissulfurirhabdus thermomarina TaxID=1765737 RepID=A0A6N9TU82_DISTH|nr:cob(I)yrinic acid a,c-diamide adenosyltransferase [Dissulfurirhabdus thermomarina]NDY42997.1 cob(I)yrinic acid a,c-diamide adenosyltransferase [Dissulfurirhabdus thermomarina]NMX23657.1 cob(I)yrinic acid a,c-diamide adenosyltransferase [Dissulfurirhabdus thermomarina]
MSGTASKPEPPPDRRFVQVYTGDGKGKTTAALGLVLRAAGAGWRVLVLQFLKRGDFSEIKALRRLPGVEVRQFGTGRFVRGRPSEADLRAARDGLRLAESALASGAYDLVVLDEANVAAHFGMLEAADLAALLDRRPPGVEVVLTGRWAPPEVLERADLVTEMRSVRHYYDRGIPAREGIER